MKSVSGKRMCRILEQRGWTLARINGSSHHIYRHADRGSALVSGLAETPDRRSPPPASGRQVVDPMLLNRQPPSK
ncbi:MAG: type II toxin-antitoxin system HicA family toxin [Pirellulaceae bacterium]|nr:type II toxin-antitoxin system HicA family toxin [Pirellulaceae bacterium]